MAQAKVLVEGYLSFDHDGMNASTVSLVLDGNVKMVVDPGYLKSPQVLIEALKKEGLTVEDINFVCITHSHLDHYRNIGLFPRAKTLEYFGVWDQFGRSEEWQEQLTKDIRIVKTPGHDNTCITLFVKTEDGVVGICGDVFWKKNYPETDPYATDVRKLHQSRKLVLEMSDWIIPGHEGMYEVENGSQEAVRQIRKNGYSANGKKEVKVNLGNCRKCRWAFTKPSDRCFCQNQLCYRCCECDMDCEVCACKRQKRYPR